MFSEEIINKFFEGSDFRVRGKSYHKSLPADLAAWYCYTSDGGHSILALLLGHINNTLEPLENLCPLPVKTVLRGYEIVGGYVVATKGFRYNNNFGLQLLDGTDEEF